LDDALDFRNYGARIADIITNSTPRFTIGIFGGWGTGKTSLMLMIKDILDNNEKDNNCLV
jgi:predicted KAP-like P-loop ATPase